MHPQWHTEILSSPDPSYGLTDTSDATLENFFSRPIKVGSYTWAVGQEFFQDFNPWVTFFGNPRVINRISNFHLLRSKLKVRFVINGNSFHYGRLLASYQPLLAHDNFTVNRALFREDLVEASQRPHVFLNPTTCQGGTLTLPFCWPNNALKIPDREWENMGTINVRSIYPLKHANGGTDGITVTAFVWAEDVHLSIPTANQPFALSPQAGENEYAGIISKPLSAVAKVAGVLAQAPSIRPYAMATQHMAQAVGSAAAAMGYSRPVSVEQTAPIVPLFADRLANTEGTDVSEKLSFDPKQELTIDPRTMGLGDADEMNLASIASREAWITNFGWNISDPSEKMLFNTRVTPSLWTTLEQEIHIPPCLFAAMPFRDWKGTMKFRFQVISSAYHKGRLRVSYDPSYQLTNEYNTNYNYVFDISSENDFTVEVGWGSSQTMLNRDNPSTTGIPYSTTQRLVSSPSSNGVLSVFVVNELTTPNTTVNNDIVVAVYVSMCADAEFFNPAGGGIDNFVFTNPVPPSTTTARLASLESEKPPSPVSLDEELKMQPQAGVQPDEMVLSQVDMPEQQDSSAILANACTEDMSTSVYYADPITSVRQVCKRYTFHHGLSSPSGQLWRTWILPNYPPYRGYDPFGLHTTAGGLRYNFCHQSPTTWYTPAFVCKRGSYRWKYMTEPASIGGGSMVMVNRFAGIGTETGLRTFPVDVGTTSARCRDAFVRTYSMWQGGAVTSTGVNPFISVTFPYHSNQRFTYARKKSVNDSTLPDLVSQHFHYMVSRGGGSSAGPPITYAFGAAGDDYTLSFFLSTPRLWEVLRTADPGPGA